MQLIAKTFNIEEAKTLERKLKLEGFTTEIREIEQTGIYVYEVWADKKEGLTAVQSKLV
ncbi:MAG: hypothetical protein AABX38_05745 [Candidatus Micrarchaeota archaeon]|mgnify:CR=1 FL=1